MVAKQSRSQLEKSAVMRLKLGGQLKALRFEARVPAGPLRTTQEPAQTPQTPALPNPSRALVKSRSIDRLLTSPALNKKRGRRHPNHTALTRRSGTVVRLEPASRKLPLGEMLLVATRRGDAARCRQEAWTKRRYRGLRDHDHAADLTRGNDRSRTHAADQRSRVRDLALRPMRSLRPDATRHIARGPCRKFEKKGGGVSDLVGLQAVCRYRWRQCRLPPPVAR